MTDPRRWFDDPDVPTAYRRLLSAATPPPPISPEFDATLSSLTAKLAAASVIGKLVAATPITKLLAVTMTLGTAMMTGYLMTSPSLESLARLTPALAAPDLERPRRALQLTPAGHAEETNTTLEVSPPLGDSPESLALETTGDPRAAAPPPVVHAAESLALETTADARAAAPPPMVHAAESLALVSARPSRSAAPPSLTNSAESLAQGAGTTQRSSATAQSGVSATRHDNSIRDEADVLERARRALSENPHRALLLADEHAERFRSGYLAAERELIAVQALVNSGRQREAKQRARRFFDAYSSSVYQRRMHQVLGEPIP